MAANDSIEVFRGEAVTLEFAMDPVEDITGWTIEFTAEDINGDTVIQTAASVVDGPNGRFDVALTATDTDIGPPPNTKIDPTLTPDVVLQYDAFRTDAGSERALAVGKFSVQDVAR